MAVELAERLSLVRCSFEQALLIGPAARWADTLLREREPTARTPLPLWGAQEGDEGGPLGTEDRLPFHPDSFDLVLSAGTLDSSPDLPHALSEIARVMRPGGLFLGVMFAAGTLSTLRRLLAEAEAPRAVARVHPQIRLRDAGDLLARAGFVLPVVDVEPLTVRYSSLARLIDDLRDLGATNALTGGHVPLSRSVYRRLHQLWNQAQDTDGRAIETFSLLHVSGWSQSAE